MIYKSYLLEKNFNTINESLILFYGENLGLKDDFKNIIKLNSKNSQFINFLQDDVIKNEELFFNEIYNFSLFEKKKTFIINNVNDKILPILKKLKLKENDHKIFLFSEILDKKSTVRNYFEKSKNLGVVPCYADNEITLKKIIIEKLKGFSGLSNQILNIIINNCGLDRAKLNNEINKIVTFFNEKKIDQDKLEILLNTRVNDSFDILKDQALIGNKSRTNSLISDTILEPEKNIFYLNLINQRLMKLLEIFKINENGNLEDAINKVKPPIFWKDKPVVNLQAKKWSNSKIKEMLNKTYNLELKIKSNYSINQQILIRKLLVDICNLANAS